MCGFRGSISLILLRPALKAPCSASTDPLVPSPHPSFWGNGQHAVETAPLIGALSNYHVGSELTLRLLDSLEKFASSREDQYHSAVVIKSPSLRAAFASQVVAHLSSLPTPPLSLSLLVHIHTRANFSAHAVCVETRNVSAVQN